MPEPSVLTRLFAEPYEFDFFQACRLLGRIQGGIHREGLGPPEPARFRSRVTLAFPASAVHDLTPPDVSEDRKRLLPPVMTVTFLGLYGTTGVLPRHYTHRLLEIDQYTRKDAGRPLRDWLDLFNHRWVWLFYRAWEKYRFWLPYERGEPQRDDPDAFTRALLAVCGLATGGLRDRVRVTLPPPTSGRPETLAAVHDLGLLRFAGLLGQRRRNAWGLDVLLAQYFEVPVAVKPFQGQWLPLDPGSKTRLGAANSSLGRDAVAGERVWDVQGKFRLRVGPLTYRQFLDYLPDRRPVYQRKAFFLLSQVAKLYAGPEFDLDVQLVLKAAEVPRCELSADEAAGPRLGWNCWLLTGPAKRDAEEAVFEGQPVTVLG
jgi:type VI secretion system protein ImpH